MKRIFLITLVFIFMGVNSAHSEKGNFMQQHKEIKDLIEPLEAGEAVYYENLTIIPLYSTKVRDFSNYITLEEALAGGLLKITELDAGQVPQVRISNDSDKHVFVIGGEIISGGKQDRIIGRDVLIGPRHTNIVVPVYCVEQGRWQYSSDKFYSNDNLGTFYLRKEAQKQEKSAQSSIWEGISRSNEKLAIRSKTSAYQDAYESDEIKKNIESFKEKLYNVPSLYPDTLGVVIGVGGEIISIDIFANSTLFNKLWPKLLKSASLSAIEKDRQGSITQQEAVNFLKTFYDKNYLERKAIDLGKELYYADKDINVNALCLRDIVIHLSAFPERYRGVERYPDEREYRIPVIRR